MPNMFGGDQMHPAYAPQSKLQSNQVVVGDDLWTVDLYNKTATKEEVSGATSIYPISYKSLPDKVKGLIDSL